MVVAERVDAAPLLGQRVIQGLIFPSARGCTTRPDAMHKNYLLDPVGRGDGTAGRRRGPVCDSRGRLNGCADADAVREMVVSRIARCPSGTVFESVAISPNIGDRNRNGVRSAGLVVVSAFDRLGLEPRRRRACGARYGRSGGRRGTVTPIDRDFGDGVIAVVAGLVSRGWKVAVGEVRVLGDGVVGWGAGGCIETGGADLGVSATLHGAAR